MRSKFLYFIFVYFTFTCYGYTCQESNYSRYKVYCTDVSGEHWAWLYEGGEQKYVWGKRGATGLGINPPLQYVEYLSISSQDYNRLKYLCRYASVNDPNLVNSQLPRPAWGSYIGMISSWYLFKDEYSQIIFDGGRYDLFNGDQYCTGKIINA